MSYKVEGACANVEFLVMGPIENNVYLIGDDSATLVVDPTCDAQRIVSALEGRAPEAIVLTHAHWDHVGAAKDLRDATGAHVVASAIDAPFISGRRQLDPSHRPFAPCPVDVAVSDGDVVRVGKMSWQVMATPGHTPGSMCLFLAADERDGAPVLIAGDTLFAGAHGRTDFVGGDPSAMRTSLKRLASLPEDTLVLPGHNGLTTIGRELPWLQRGSLA